MRLLLVGDDPRDALAIREALAQTGGGDYRLEHAEGLSRGLDRVRTDPPDVLLLPLRPEGDGLAPLVQVRPRAPDVPIVVPRRRGDERVPHRAVQQGAHD